MVDLVYLYDFVDHGEVDEDCVVVLFDEDGKTVHDSLVCLVCLGLLGDLIHKTNE